MVNSSATAEGTAQYAARFPSHHSSQFYRIAQGLTVSSLGIGTYLGNLDQATGDGYVASVTAALRGGINFIDTSLNYRNQASERNIGQALSRLFEAGELKREEAVISTKAGYLTPGAVPAGALKPADVVGNMHSMAPVFLEDQLGRSRANLGLEAIDVFYLHNPETQLQYVPESVFYERVRIAFASLEEMAAAGRIRYYGTATWNGYRSRTPGEGLSLEKLAEIARESGGEGHRFRFIQLPFNLAMLEGLPVLAKARELGITVVASASILQARLARGLPEEVGRKITGARTDAQRAIQFARSAPGITVALVGMSNPAHVEENLGVAALAPADVSAWLPAASR